MALTIYVTHSTGFDYKNNLYHPLKTSALLQAHHFIFPHAKTAQAHDSKAIIQSADLIIAEVSYPSTGQGIELGWANLLQIPIVAVVQANKNYSSALTIITQDILEYSDTEDLPRQLNTYLLKAQLKPSN